MLCENKGCRQAPAPGEQLGCGGARCARQFTRPRQCRLLGAGLRCAVNFARHSSNEARLLFNSLGAFSSVNHLHFHIFSLADAVQGGPCRTPIEACVLSLAGTDAGGAALHSVAGWSCEASRPGLRADVPACALAPRCPTRT